MNSRCKRNWWLILCLLAAAPALGGCSGLAGNAARLFEGDSVDPVFKPQDRPTLVIVEQESGPAGPALGDPTLSGVIAQNIIFNLNDEKAITQFVPSDKLVALQNEYGDKFKDVPDTELGRKLGAAQVLRVTVRSASVSSEPGVLHPQAVVFVWLSDTASNQVIFPVPGTGNDVVAPEAQTGPYVVNVSLEYKSSSGDNSSALASTLQRMLAQRVGRDVSRLFYSYVPDKPNAP